MLVKTWSSTLMRAAARLVEDAGYTAEDAGFRCARETEVWPEATD
jgi:formylglycine-generating enzyme required for sulfatase activity